MPELGHVALALAVLASLWAAGAAAVAARRGHTALLRSAEAALAATFVVLSVATILLLLLFLGREFEVEYVAQYSDRSLSPVMTASALWAGEDGSLLFWAWVLAGTSSLAARVHRTRDPGLQPVMVATLGAALVVFSALTLLASNPFTRLDFVPSDGAGLNPMLLHWGQILHPPATFVGYALFTVPFALAIAALVSGRLDGSWLRGARAWTIHAWLWLGIGIVLGARWAYTELGWGGYWAWDPVENVSLLPWLTATAWLHTVVLQQRRGALRVWNLALAIATFALVIFATFLVRSGVAASVHAFAESPAGVWFLAVIVTVVVAGAGLLAWRLPQLRPRRRTAGGLSRESLLVLTNGLLVAYTVAIFWGTIFPVLTSAVQGSEVSVGAPFFDAVSRPVGVLMLLLLGLGPLVAWRSAGTGLRRALIAPTIAGLVAGTVAGVLDGGANPLTVAVLALVAFAGVAILGDLWAGARAAQRGGARDLHRAAGRSLARNPRRVGGALAHLGIVLLIVGLAVDGTYRDDARIELEQGETAQVGPYALTFTELATEEGFTRSSVAATLSVARSGTDRGELTAERYLEGNMEEPRTEVGVRSLVREDLYVVLEDVDVDAPAAGFHVNRHPGVLWLWVGSTLTLLGGLLAVLPWRRPERRDPAAPAERGDRDADPTRVTPAGGSAPAGGPTPDGPPTGAERREGPTRGPGSDPSRTPEPAGAPARDEAGAPHSHEEAR